MKREDKVESCPWCKAAARVEGFDYDGQSCRCGWPRVLKVAPRLGFAALICSHSAFHTHAAIDYLADRKAWMVAVRIHCVTCGLPFQFLGLPWGLDLGGAAMSPGGAEARIAMAPADDDTMRAEGFSGVPTHQQRMSN